MDNNIITLDEAIATLRGRPGLVYGAASTTSPNCMSLIIESAKTTITELDDLEENGLSEYLDKLSRDNPGKSIELENYIASEIKKLSSVNDISYLVQAGWSMCISLTLDTIFEEEIKNYQDTLPTSKAVTLVDHPTVRPQSRTLPIYKLLGNTSNAESGKKLALSESDILLRKASWKNMLGTCTDFLQGGPLLFFGTNRDPGLAQELLSNLASLPPPAPNSLLFLKDDPLLANSTILSLSNSFSNVKIIDTTIKELSNAIKNVKPRQGSLDLVAVEDGSGKILSEFEAVLSVVPFNDIEETQFESHRHQLVDSLFRPSSIDWNPYLCNLDLVRDSTGELLESIDSAFGEMSTGNSRNIIVRGTAGVGKTTLLKRAAIELSKKGALALWCRKPPMENWLRVFKKLASDLSDLPDDSEKKKQCVIFIDDPWALRMDPSELILCFGKCELPLVFVISVRDTEYFNSSGLSYNLPYSQYDTIEVPTLLGDEELERLSLMLVRIGAVVDIEDAERLVKTIPNKDSKDVLCSLWYLLPQTRKNLSDSLKDEYHRLGAASKSITSFAQDANSMLGEAAQHAYEYVAVTSKFHVGLSMEVLVRALKISYEEFIDMLVDGKPLWGLLYDEDGPEQDSVYYRTRNEVVTRILLELVNGGVGHAGEFRVLKNLLGSCDIGTQIYREFAIDVLVKSNKDIEKYFTYEQGIELFEAAQNSLPHEDRLLAHHKGIWMHRVGKDYLKAYQQLEKSLEYQQYPGSEREAHPEHIHTSLAATTVALIRDGTQSPEEGFLLVKDHLLQATNPRIFNAHSGHVSANLLFEIAQQQGIRDNVGVGLSSYSEALKEVEKTLQSIGPNWRNNARTGKSVELLKELQGRIIDSIPDIGVLEQYAHELFSESKNQLGFELLLRKHFSIAQMLDKGRNYNAVKEKIESVIETIENKLESPSTEIIAIRTDLVVRWRLQSPKGGVDWDGFENDLKIVLADAKYRDDPMKNFYHAVAIFHLGKIEQSNAIFMNLRRINATGLMPKLIRCFAVGPEGYAKRYQCNINSRHERTYAEVPELSTDILVAGTGNKTANHIYIAFTLNGPLAFFDKPDAQHAILA
tara:strand:- start:1087 stop:4365 length:3279 start_codon:yes stop_codon:yes gene_type:complete